MRLCLQWGLRQEKLDGPREQLGGRVKWTGGNLKLVGWEGGHVQAVIGGEGGEEGGGSEIVFEVGGAAREDGRVEREVEGRGGMGGGRREK